jgi:ribosome-associated protein
VSKRTSAGLACFRRVGYPSAQEDSAIARLAITPTLSLDPAEIAISFIRASGPGGQNVNKVSSAAQLRFDLKGSPSLPAGVKSRAARLAGSRLTTEGEIVITADRHRTQALNRDDAVARLLELLAAAAVPPKPRRPTRPTLASKQRRLERKSQRSGVKRLRSGRPELD